LAIDYDIIGENFKKDSSSEHTERAFGSDGKSSNEEENEEYTRA
jgi:hypothetical protein